MGWRDSEWQASLDDDKSPLEVFTDRFSQDSDVATADLRLYARHLYGSLDPTPELFVHAALRTDGRARRIMGEHWSGASEGYRQRRVVAESARPIGVVHGMADPFICHAYLRGVMWGRLWGGDILRLDGIGHTAFLEAPDCLKRFLLDFARECGAKREP